MDELPVEILLIILRETDETSRLVSKTWNDILCDDYYYMTKNQLYATRNPLKVIEIALAQQEFRLKTSCMLAIQVITSFYIHLWRQSQILQYTSTDTLLLVREMYIVLLSCWAKRKNLILSDLPDSSFLLNVATRNNHLLIVKELVKSGINVHLENEKPLRGACRNGHLDVVRFLCEHANADSHVDNDRPFLHAVFGGHLRVVEYLVEEQGVDVSTNFNDGIITAASNGHLGVLQFLVHQGEDIHIWEDEPVKAAAANAHFEVILWLLENGADVEKAMEGARKAGNHVLYFIENFLK